MTYDELAFWKLVYETVIRTGFTNEVALFKANQAAKDLHDSKGGNDDLDDAD